MPIARESSRMYSIVPDKQQYVDKLPLGVYGVRQTPFGYKLERIEDFSLPNKLYGSFKDIEYWKKSFEHFEKNQGILLSGLKGTGKTIEAKKFCIEMGRPVILIESGFADQGFINFMTNPELRDSVVFIDEFEKHYRDKMESLLGLLDGAYNTKFAFVLTVNKENISEYLMNRLGRIKYTKKYDTLDSEVIDEVIDDMLVNTDHRESIHVFFHGLGMCTFDLLTTMIADMNLFGEDALKCGKRFNVQSVRGSYTITETINGQKVSERGAFDGDIADLYAMSAAPEDADLNRYVSFYRDANGFFNFQTKYNNRSQEELASNDYYDAEEAFFDEHPLWKLLAEQDPEQEITGHSPNDHVSVFIPHKSVEFAGDSTTKITVLKNDKINYQLLLTKKKQTSYRWGSY